VPEPRPCRSGIYDLAVGAGDLTEDPQGLFGSPGVARESWGVWRKIIRGSCLLSTGIGLGPVRGRPMLYSSIVFTYA